MRVNADELNKLLKLVLEAADYNDKKAEEKINNLDNLFVGCYGSNFFKVNDEGKQLLLKVHKGKLYHYCLGDDTAKKLDNATLSKFDITYNTLRFMRLYLGNDFRPIYLNVNDLYTIANKIYDFMKEQFPRTDKCYNMLRTINFIEGCGGFQCYPTPLFRTMDGCRLRLITKKDRIYQLVLGDDKTKSNNAIFVSNSTLKDFPLTREGERFIYSWLK